MGWSRERERRLTKTVLARAAVVAGVATGIGVAWQIQRSDWWQSTITTDPRSTRARVARPRASAGLNAPVRWPSTARALAPPAAAPVGRPASRPVPSAPVSVVPEANGPTAAAALAVAVAPVAKPAQAPTERIAGPLAPVALPLSPRPSVPLPLPQRPRLPEPRAARQQPEPTQPFDAVLGTILYAPDRRLAIVDGRIVQVGDDVRGARVVEITPTAVLLRDGQGGLRRLGLGAASP